MFGLFRKKLPTAGAAAPSAPVRADEDLATPASFRDFEFGPEMVVVPAGEFLMGGGISSTEHPVHRISIDRPFAVSRFPVTCDEWDRAVAACVADEKKAYFVRVRGAERKARQPAAGLSWFDAYFYCLWVSEKFKQRYRLLSEAEWEYCCRAGSTTAYSFGDELTDRQACFGVEETVDVGRYPANAFGLHDMHGNVWEWVEDNHHPNYDGAPTDGSAWHDPAMQRYEDGSPRVLRGGSCFCTPVLLASSFRHSDSPGSCDYDVGFRVARDL